MFLDSNTSQKFIMQGINADILYITLEILDDSAGQGGG